MKQIVRNLLVYFIGILALVVATISIIISGVELLGQIKEVKSLFSITNTALYSSIIEVVFAGMELFMGIDLIKKWRKGEHFEVQKSISQLVSAIVYASMLQIFMFVLLNTILTDASSVINVSTIYIILGVVFTIFISSIGKYVQKRQLMNVLVTMLIISLIAIVLGVYECVINFKSEVAFVDGFIMFSNLVIIVLVLVFEIYGVIYYRANPLILEETIREGEDVDVIKQTDKYETVKIYATRVQEGSINVANTIIYISACVLFAVGIILYAIEHNVASLFVGSFGGFVTNIKQIIYSSSVSKITDILCVLVLVVIYPLAMVSFIDGVIRRKGKQKVSVSMLTSVGVMILTFSSFSLILDLYMDFTFKRTIDFSNYSIVQIAMLLINLGYMLLSKILTNIQRNINSGISGGDSYHSHSKAVKKVALLTGIYSCLCYVTLFLHYYLDLQTLSLTYVFMFVATILFIVGTFIESKYPYNEFTIVKRKRIDKEIETCIKEEGLNPIN